jgi:uridine kinase
LAAIGCFDVVVNSGPPPKSGHIKIESDQAGLMEAKAKPILNPTDKLDGGTPGAALKSVAQIGYSSFALVVFAKVLLMVLFSSGYMNQLFVPFVQHFIGHFDNPWDFYFQTTAQRDQFPYQPLMLYIVAFFCLPLKLVGFENTYLVNFFMKLPTLLSDILVAFLLVKMFPARVNKVFWYYFLSPIILYACYIHSQLDLIPTAILFSAVYFLRKHDTLKSALLFGLALATKSHVVAALPLCITYIYRNQKPKMAGLYLVCSLLMLIFWVYPFLSSPGFQAIVLHNPKQSQIFESYISIGSMHIFLPVLAVCSTYVRFALYPKINLDLLDAFLNIVFALFVALIVPAPGWYVWIVPFLSIFMIKYSRRDSRIVPAGMALSCFYLFYFLFFHHFDYPAIMFCGNVWNLGIPGEHLSSLAFTLLEATLLANIVLCYRTGVRSNSIYKRERAIVIGIGGDSGAGKSTLLKDIKALLQNRVVELEGDADHKWARHDENWKKDITHLDPKANFLHRQADTLFNLKRGRSVERVDYDHSTGAFTSARVIEPNDFIVLSGLHTFYLPKSRKVIDLKIFMDPEAELKSFWKVSRDHRERGYTEKQANAQISRRKNDADKFISPQREFADLCIRYYPQALLDEGSLTAQANLSLKLSLSSSIHLEDLVQELMANGLLLHWDYSENLSKQDLTLSEPVPPALLQKLASEMIPNLEELVESKIEWAEDLRGFVQLIILLIINDLMKDKEEMHEV